MPFLDVENFLITLPDKDCTKMWGEDLFVVQENTFTVGVKNVE